MRRRMRTGWVVKWLVTGLCVAALLGFFASFRWVVRAHAAPVAIVMCNGDLCLGEVRDSLALTIADNYPRTFFRAEDALWLPRLRAIRLGLTSGPYRRELHVPIWMIFAALALWGGVLWWRDRRLPGRCENCGYDLTGNVSGRCPECGAPVRTL